MSDLKSEVKQIEEYLNDNVPFTYYKRYDEPEFQVLKTGAEMAGRMLARYELVVARLKAISQYRELQVQAFMRGIRIPDESAKKIEELIADFITKLKKGDLINEF